MASESETETMDIANMENRPGEKMKGSKRKAASWSISSLGQKMLISARPSQKMRGMKEATASSSCSHLEAKEQVEASKWQMQRTSPQQVT